MGRHGIMGARNECGQALGVWVLVIAIAAMALAGLVGETRVAHTEARAQSIADLAALAGVHDQTAAFTVARRSGAQMVSIVAGRDGRVTVTVSLDDVVAVASAQPDTRSE